MQEKLIPNIKIVNQLLTKVSFTLTSNKAINIFSSVNNAPIISYPKSISKFSKKKKYIYMTIIFI